MTWVAMLKPDGTSGAVWVPDSNVPTPTDPNPTVIPLPAPTGPLAQPDNPAQGVTLNEVLTWYLEFLGRPADVATEAQPRVGNDRQQTYDEIRCSEEAANYRTAHGAEPDSYCFTLVVKPPAVTNPPAGSGAGGSAGGGGGGGGGGSTGGGHPLGGNPTATIDLSGLGQFLSQVSDALGTLTTNLGSKVQQLSNDVGSGLAEVQSAISTQLGRFAPIVGNAFNELTSKIGQVVQGLVPTTLSLVGSALGGVESIVSAMFGSMASLDDVVSAITAALSGNVGPLGSFISDAFGNASAFGITGALHLLEQEEPAIIDQFVGKLRAAGPLPDYVESTLSAVQRREHPLPVIPIIAGLIAAIFTVSSVIIEPEMEKIRQQVYFQNPSRVTPVESVVDAAARSLREYPTLETLARRYGYDESQFRLMVDTRLRFAEVDVLFANYFRGEIAEGQLDSGLAKLGYTDENVAYLKVAMQNIPNVSDVLRFLVRDVFIPEFVQQFGMDLEYPQDADTWAKKLGIPHEVMQLHWRAHWELPSVSLGYQMFQRSKIDETALRRLLRAQGVEPFWRDPLIAISYNPLPRVQLRQMDSVGAITDEQLLRGYLDLGYSPEQAKMQFDFTKAYNGKTKKKELADLTDSLKSRVVSAVMNATLTETEGTQLLKQVGYEDAEISAFLAEARLLRQETLSKKVADLIGKLYVDGFRTEAEARQALSEHGYIPSEVDLILREWNLEKELKTPSDSQLKGRDLTATNVITAFEDGAMTETDSLAYLKNLRYDDKEAAVLIDTAKYKVAKQEEKDATDAIHVQVLSGRLSEDEASAQLSQLNVPAKKRDALLAKWALERHGKVEKIPLSSLKDILARGLWTDEKMTSYLRATGYSDDDIQALLILWGSQNAEKKARAEAAAAKQASKTTTGGTGQ